MADIEYKCVSCGKPRVVSEFADASKIKCATCGGGLQKPGEAPVIAPPPPPTISGTADDSLTEPSAPPTVSPPPVGGSRLKLAKQQREQLEAAQAEKNETAAEPKKSKSKSAEVKSKPEEAFKTEDIFKPQTLELHPKTKTKQKGASHVVLSSLVFLFIGGIMGYLRYAAELGWPGSDRLPVEQITNVMQYAWIAILVLNFIVVFRAMSDNMFQGLLCLLIPGWSVIYLLFISDNFYLRAFFFGCLVGVGQDGGMQLYGYAADFMQGISEFINSGGGAIR